MQDHLVGLTIALQPEEMDSSTNILNTNKINDSNTPNTIFTLADTCFSNFPPSTKVITKFGVVKAVPLPQPAAPPFSPRSHSYKDRGPSGSYFLERCTYCRQIMSPTSDVYMYMGEKAFCTAQCRYEYVFWDEKATKTSEENSFLSSLRPPSGSSSSSSSSSKNKGKAHK